MDKVKVNMSRLRSDAEQMKASIRNIDNAMSNLKLYVSELDQLWDGSSSEAFKAAFNADMEALQSLISNFRQINYFETNAEEKYVACDSQVAELIANIRV